MAKFLIEARYGPEGVRGVAAEGGSSRRDTVAEMISSRGGTMEAFYFALGETDVYVIADVPDNETAVALALAINGSGAVTSTTKVLLTPEQVDKAAQTRVDYRAPGA